jgi:hypothetical protein
MAQLRIITEKGISKNFDRSKAFSEKTNRLIEKYWKNHTIPLFYRTREELESLIGLGKYSKITNRYESEDANVIGIEISFDGLGSPKETILKLRPFTIWNALDNSNWEKSIGEDSNSQFPEMIQDKARIVVTKETIINLIRHIDPILAWDFNQHRAFMLEITVGEDEEGKFVAILRHIHYFIDDFLCAESHNPVRIPPGKDE